MGKRGPVGKTAKQHEIDGTFRAYRDTGNSLAPPVVGEPVKPAGMTKRASAFWDRLIPNLMTTHLCGVVDADAIAECCKLWDTLQGCHSRLNRKSSSSELIHVMLAVSRLWQASAASIGLTPAGRQRMRLPEGESKPDDPFLALMKARQKRSASN